MHPKYTGLFRAYVGGLYAQRISRPALVANSRERALCADRSYTRPLHEIEYVLYELGFVEQEGVEDGEVICAF